MTEIRHRRLATAAAFASLFAFAATVSVTPAALNEIGKFYHASNSSLGVLFLASSLAFCVTVTIGGRISDRWRKLPVLTIGCATMAVGGLLFAHTSDFLVALVASTIMGIGGGFTEGIAMAVVSELYGDDKRTAMMNGAQVFFALGAIVSPAGVAGMIGLGLSWRWSYVAAASMCAVCAVLGAKASSTGLERSMAEHHRENPWTSVITDPLVIALSVGILLYVAAEAGQGNWVAVYFETVLKSSGWVAALSVSLFWAGIGLGRFVAALLSKRLSDVAIIIGSLALAACFQTAVLLAHGPGLAGVGVVLLGFCLAPVWPTILSRAGAMYPRQSGTVFGILVAMGAGGVAIAPPIIGRLGDIIGIRQALWGCVLLLVVNLAMFVVLSRRLSTARE